MKAFVFKQVNFEYVSLKNYLECLIEVFKLVFPENGALYKRIFILFSARRIIIIKSFTYLFLNFSINFLKHLNSPKPLVHFIVIIELIRSIIRP